MAANTLGVLLVALLCMCYTVRGHVRFVCPRPMSVRSDISFSSQSVDICGANVSEVLGSVHYSEVQPGLFTLRFEETKFHQNSPFRVSLHKSDSTDYCVLLDHIPHNNHGAVSSNCEQQGNAYPLGICDSSTYYITVNIPDIECNHCYLQLTHIVLDAADNIPCDLHNGTCSGYSSCAAIKIRPSAVGEGRNISSCVSYEDNLAGEWPFRPQDYYAVEVPVGQDKVDPMVIFDPMYRTLHLDIPRHGFLHEIEEVLVLLNGSAVWNVTVTEEHRLPDTVVVLWAGMADDVIQRLRNDQLVLRIKCKTDSYDGNITLQMQNYTEGVYTKMERTEYSEDGWLADYRFRGMYTKDLTVVTPAGPCAPSARHFIGFLHPPVESSEFMHGLLVSSIVGDYANIAMVFYNINSGISTITVQGSQLLGAPDLSIPVVVKDNILQVSLDVSRQVPYLDTVQFLKSVEVKTDDPSEGLSGNFEEGMYTILREGRAVKGIGAFQFTKGQWLKYEILISGLTSKVERIELTGDKGVTYNLSDSVWHLESAFCLVEGLVQDLSSKLLLQLWQGRLLLTAYTNTSVLQGAVTVPGSVYCEEARDTACFIVNITLDGKPQVTGQETVPPSGKAVFLLDGPKVLQYSIDIDNMQDGHMLEASVRDGEQLVFTIKMAPHQHRPATYTATGHLPVPSDWLKKLSAGGLKLEVFPSSISPSALRGYLPPIKDHLCVQPKKRVVGDHRGYWSAEAAPFQTMFAIVGDSLEFKYEGNVSLFSFPDQEAFKACNFTNASQLGPDTFNSTQVTHTVRLLNVETLFFASMDHCNSTRPLRLRVRVLQPVPPSVGDSTDKCGSLVFSDWRQKRLDAYNGPEPTGPAIAGFVIGTLVALAFFFWDRRLRQKSDLAVPGSRFQRF